MKKCKRQSQVGEVLCLRREQFGLYMHIYLRLVKRICKKLIRRLNIVVEECFFKLTFNFIFIFIFKISILLQIELLGNYLKAGFKEI